MSTRSVGVKILISMSRAFTEFAAYPIQRVARDLNHGGVDDAHFDDSILPLTTVEGATIENIRPLLVDDEFDYLKGHLADEAIKLLGRIHRSPDYKEDGRGGLILGNELQTRSQNIVAEISACLRLIRPTAQRTQMFTGAITRTGGLATRALNNPIENVQCPSNQLHFAVNTADIHQLLFYAPRFRAAMQGENWKFRMAVSMHELGHFQNSEWKARFFLWSSALEGLFTSKPKKAWTEHSGSLVAAERIMDLLGKRTSIYPPGDLTSLEPDPGIAVEDVIGDIYCLRNHLAHGDKVPDYYFRESVRRGPLGPLAIADMLLEAISFIVRSSLLKILQEDLVNNFQDGPSSEAYFTSRRLTKSLLPKSLKYYECKA
jgi:hypothetical protein